MKKLITLLLVVTMITACMVPTVFAAGTAVSVSSATAVPGDTVTLNVSISGNPGFVSGKVTVSYDSSALELVSMSNVMFQGLTYNNQANHASAMAVTGDGVLCTATFKVIATSDCTASVSASVSGMRDANGTLIDVAGSSGSVNVTVPHVHDYTATVTAPTCEDKGYTTYTCSCGDTYTADEVAALGHTYGDWTVTKEATCGAAGEKTRTCSVCGDVETDAIAALDHTYGDWTVTKEATCTEKGEETSTCSVCGDEKTREIAALGHSSSNWTVTKEATCTEDGLKTGTCSVCGETNATEVIPATGHSYGDWTVTKEATCTEDGEKTRTCSACGDVETESIPAVGHSYTYTDNGDSTHTGTCSNCGDKVSGKHEYENNGFCSCGTLKPGTVTEKDEDLDDVPATGDITSMVTFGTVAVISMAAAAAFVLKRKTAK